nr:RNA-dependent RNA polymerase [Narnavirus sp.]
MSLPDIVPVHDCRTSAQEVRDGTIKVDHRWYLEFLDANPGSILHGWDEIPSYARERRVIRSFPFELKTDVVVKLSRADSEFVKRVVNLVLAFEDNLIFSDPEYFPKIYRSREYNRLFKWVVSSEVYSPGSPVDEWKSFIQVVRWHAFRSQTEKPEGPRNFPGFRRQKGLDELHHFWAFLVPWLIPVWREGLTSKLQCTRLMHFLSSRNMPAASKKKRNASLEEHFRVLTSEGPDLASRNEWLRGAAYHYGRRLRAESGETITGAHLSVTNSASFLSSVKEGGRGVETASLFRSWIMKKPESSEQRLTWFGKPYWLEKDTPQWETMCREVKPQSGEPGDSSYLTEVDFTPGAFRYEDPIYCLDQYTGFQIFQWSLEEGISRGFIQGKPYRDPDGLSITGKAPLIRASAIGEPGNKSRVVTVGEGWLTIFLQPYAHALIGILKRDSDAKAGLSRAWQGFEYVKRWAGRDKLPPEEQRFILSSDLKTATDYCPHGYSRSLLKGFIDGLGLETELTNLWVDLLTCGRTYVSPFGKKITTRGILMGDPGAKLVLSLFNKVAEMEAQVRYKIGTHLRMSGKYLLRHLEADGLHGPQARLFAFAGDDHVALGPVNYLRQITASHIRNGMCVSTTTNYISCVAAVYCEEMVFIRSTEVWKYWGSNIPLYKSPYQENPHVDALKLRLLSLCRKEHEGKNDANPAIGMSSSLRGMIHWFAEGWETTRGIVSKRFRQKMRGLIPENLFLAALPKELGGIECPVFDVPDTELQRHFLELPDLHKRVIALVMRKDEKTNPSFRRMLSQIPSMSALRGVDPDSIEESVREVLSSELCQSIRLSEIRVKLGFSETDWEQLRFTDKLALINQRTEYISVGSAVQAVMRPYIFRDILFPEMSAKHGICPFRTKAYANLHWKRRFERFYDAVEGFLSKSEEAREQINSVSESEMESIHEKILSIMEDPSRPDIHREVVFLPRKVVFTETLCTLQLPGIY